MGCLVNMFKIVLGIFLILIMLVVGFKLVFDPYRPESPNSCWSHKSAEMDTQQNEPSIDNISYDVPMQTGTTHDYIMANTFQKQFVRMELDPELEKGLVFVIKAFKTVFGQDFSPTITSAHDSFNTHDKWSPHRWGRAVDIALLRRVLLREVALIASLQLHVLRYLILIVELHLPPAVVDVGRAKLIILSRQRFVGIAIGVIICRRITVDIIVVGLPSVVIDRQIEEMLVREIMPVGEFSIVHVVLSVGFRPSDHQSVVHRRNTINR